MENEAKIKSNIKALKIRIRETKRELKLMNRELTSLQVKLKPIKPIKSAVHSVYLDVPQIAADYFTGQGLEVTADELKGDSRKSHLVTMRNICYYAATINKGIERINIAKIFNRDHSTALHGIEKVEDELTIYKNKEIKRHIDNLIQIIEELKALRDKQLRDSIKIIE